MYRDIISFYNNLLSLKCEFWSNLILLGQSEHILEGIVVIRIAYMIYIPNVQRQRKMTYSLFIIQYNVFSPIFHTILNRLHVELPLMTCEKVGMAFLTSH